MLYTTETNWLRANQTGKVCPQRECPVELLACCCRAISSGVGAESLVNTAAMSVKLPQASEPALFVVGCWFIPDDSIWLHGWQARYASKWSHAGSTDRSPARFILADDSRENSWSIGALLSLPCHGGQPNKLTSSAPSIQKYYEASSQAEFKIIYIHSYSMLPCSAINKVL